MSDLVLLAEADGVATLVLNRPDRLNAFDLAMREQCAAALSAIATGPDVRVLVVTGAGRAFSAGGDVGFMVDLKQRETPFESGLGRLVDGGARAIAKLVSLPFPTIASINGVAAGGAAN